MNLLKQASPNEAVLEAFRNIRVYVDARDGKRAVNKPLLLLLTLGFIQRERRPALSFNEIEPTLIELLKRFGPRRATYSALLPFWYLRNDGDGALWVVENAEHLASRKGKGFEPTASTFRQHNTRAGLAPQIFDAIVADPVLLAAAAKELLWRHFPETLHEDIADAVGLELELAALGKRMRDPRFRDHVLNAYAHCCSICGFDARLGGRNVGLEAAHIRWVQMLGSNNLDNGLAMCSLHHKLFDAGALTIEWNGHVYRVLFSAELNGASEAFRKWLLRAHRANLHLLPLDPAHRPHPDNLRWHHREVFKRPELNVPAI